MTDQANTDPKPQDAGTQALLDQLPGLVGAIDNAIKDTSGKHMAFMLLVFADEAVLHATNADPAIAQDATRAYVQALNDQAAGNGAESQPVAE